MTVEGFVWSVVAGLLSSAVVVFVGVKRLQDYIADVTSRRVATVLARFWCSPRRSSNYAVVFGVQARENGRFSLSPRIGYAQAYAVSEVTNALRVIDPRSDVRLYPVKMGDKVPKTVFDENVVFIGGEIALPCFRDVNLKLGVPFYQHEMLERDRAISRLGPDGRVAQVFYSQTDKAGDALIRDVGTVVRIENPINRKLIVLYNANHSAGLLGAIFLTCRHEALSESSMSSAPAQQIVIEVDQIRDNLIDRDHPLTFQRWTAFEVQASDVEAMIASVAS